MASNVTRWGGPLQQDCENNQLVMGFAPRRSEFDLWILRVWFVMDKVALEQVFSFVSPNQRSVFIVIHPMIQILSVAK